MTLSAKDRWTSGADYDRWMGRWSRLLAREFLRWLQIPAGLRWIDVCCGSGVLTEEIVEANTPARVAGIDASAEQIQFAQAHRGQSNVTFKVGNAMSLPFPDESFDAAVCGLGLNYIPNAAEALGEFKRVVCPEGTIALYVWDYEQGARFLREFWDAAAAVDPSAAEFDQANRFPMCTEAGLKNLFEGAGLRKIATHGLNINTRFSSFEDYWQPLLSGQGSAPNYLASRDRQVQAAICRRLKDALPMDSEGAIELPARAWAIRARRA